LLGEGSATKSCSATAPLGAPASSMNGRMLTDKSAVRCLFVSPPLGRSSKYVVCSLLHQQARARPLLTRAHRDGGGGGGGGGGEDDQLWDQIEDDQFEVCRRPDSYTPHRGGTHIHLRRPRSRPAANRSMRRSSRMPCRSSRRRTTSRWTLRPWSSSCARSSPPRLRSATRCPPPPFRNRHTHSMALGANVTAPDGQAAGQATRRRQEEGRSAGEDQDAAGVRTFLL
jgi:hypothetical protein